MKRFLYVISTLIFILAILFTNINTVLASEGDDGHQLEVEVSGYHVTLSSQNEWVKGENTLVVTLTDSMGMPVSNAEVEVLIAQKSNGHTEAESDGHGESESDSHTEVEADTHGSEPQHDSMPGMDMGETEPETTETSAHDEEIAAPMQMAESDEHGVYVVETHLEASGEHEVQVFFHVNGEMLRADFVVEVPGISSKTVILWSFVTVNVGLVASASVLKRQSISMKRQPIL